MMEPPQSFRSRVFAAIFVAVLIATVTFVAPAASGAADRYTPLVMHVFKPPQWFRDTDGTYQLVYELELTNGIPAPVAATKLVVRDAKSGRPVARLSGKQLTAAMSPLGNAAEATAEVAAGGVSVVWMEIPFESRKQIPDAIDHTLTVTPSPGLPLPKTITSTGGASRVVQRAPVTVAPPVQGPGWVTAGSCCDGPHRRALQPVNGHLALGQRFAIDFNRGNSEGRWVVGDPDVNKNWIFYGDPVLAVADGVVEEAVDRYPDQIPNHQKPVNLTEADGNHVIIRFGKGLYAGYAHLIPGSIKVHDGQRVRAGQVIGLLGNSGASGGPHLHFQVMDKPSLVDAEGLPFAFPDFTFEGRIPPLSEGLLKEINAGDPIPVDPAEAGPRHDELPIGGDVVGFP